MTFKNLLRHCGHDSKAKRVFATAVLTIALSISALAHFPNHVKELRATVYPLQWLTQIDAEGHKEIRTHCSIFSVNPEHRGWMTAAHCVMNVFGKPISGVEPGQLWTDAFLIDGHPARIVEVDPEHDLALVQTTDWGVKSWLRLARRAPEQGDWVENLGYSWGFEHPFYFAGVVSSTEYSDYIYGALMAIGGQSGSPVVDSEGRVVGVTHVGLSDNPFSEMSPINGFTIYSVLKAYDRGWVFQK